MIPLNADQIAAVEFTGDIVVTACPGSGKTRVLTQRVARGLAELSSPTRRIVAMTYTNRATDEIRKRLDLLGVDQSQLWAGTIHSFAIEWVLRPYAPYSERLRQGFTVADEFATDRLLSALKGEFGLAGWTQIPLRRNRNGNRPVDGMAVEQLLQKYDAQLAARRLIDYDDVLYFAYRLLTDRREIAETLASIVALFCVDEIQDTHDLQYGILSRVIQASAGETHVFCVGDNDQAIYESLGAVVKTPHEIGTEFGRNGIAHRTLTGNYRSTQRIIDLYQCIRPGVTRITSYAKHAIEKGRVTFRNQHCTREELPAVIAGCIQDSLDAAVQERDICVVAPQWWHVRSIGRALVALLPDVSFAAPGLSPLHAQRENIWFKIARLFLTSPVPELFNTRMRWAWEVLRDLAEFHEVSFPPHVRAARSLLRFANGIKLHEKDGLAYLRLVFEHLIDECKIVLAMHPALIAAYEDFFAKAETRITDYRDGEGIPVTELRKLFKHPAGVVIDTCHGVKGEEYDTVIAFGLLRGYVPNWNDIIDRDAAHARARESKLLYVLCSRAKKRLHLIAESGRKTKPGNPYETSPLLAGIEFPFDTL